MSTHDVERGRVRLLLPSRLALVVDWSPSRQAPNVLIHGRLPMGRGPCNPLECCRATDLSLTPGGIDGWFPRCALDTPSDWQRLLLERVQASSARNAQGFRAYERPAVHFRHRRARDVGCLLRHSGRKARSALGDVRGGHLLL